MTGTRSPDASALLWRTAVTEGDRYVCSALLTEQAALFFLRMQHPYHRKYSFHMAMAGNLYLLSHQPKHAVRCLSAALTGYGHKQWALVEVRPPFRRYVCVCVRIDGPGLIGSRLCFPVIECVPILLLSAPLPPPQDYIYLSLSRLLSRLGDPGTSAGFLSHLLTYGGSRLPPDYQRSILAEFVSAYRAFAARRKAMEGAPDAPTGPLSLSKPGIPQFEDDSVMIVSWDNACAAKIALERVVADSEEPPQASPGQSTDPHDAVLSCSGSADGLWVGHREGEGFVTEPEPKVWKRLRATLARDLGVAAKGGAYDWRAECKRIANEREDAVDVRDSGYKLATGLIGRVADRVVCEPVCVLVTAVNPLGVELTVSQVHLWAEWEGGAGAGEPAPVSSDVWRSSAITPSDVANGYTCLPVEVIMQPRERKQVCVCECAVCL